MKIKSLLQSTFDTSAKVCSKLDAAFDKNITRGKKSWQGMKAGSLSARSKSYFRMSASFKLAGAEKIAKLPFAAVRSVSGLLLK